jgi:hypothetical protein
VHGRVVAAACPRGSSWLALPLLAEQAFRQLSSSPSLSSSLQPEERPHLPVLLLSWPQGCRECAAHHHACGSSACRWDMALVGIMQWGSAKHCSPAGLLPLNC